MPAMTLPPADSNDVTVRRKRAVRTAWLVAGIAITVYVVFILSGVLAS